jgi:hypothetical protein
MKRTPLKRRTKEEVKARAAAKAVRKPKPKKEPVPSVAVLDRLFSLYIRKRALEDCQLHGYGGIQCTSQMQCSHILSRRFYSVRWDVRNAVCVCSAHHWAQHQRPYENAKWLEELLGEEHLEALHCYWRTGMKPTPDEKRDIARWLREELKK